jgi:hypothetical protein
VGTINFPIDSSNRRDTRIFDHFHFTAADVGRTVTVTRDTDPQFDAFTAMLTDAVKQQMVLWFLPEPEVNETGGVYSESLVA